jgi:hypothetical protein
MPGNRRVTNVPAMALRGTNCGSGTVPSKLQHGFSFDEGLYAREVDRERLFSASFETVTEDRRKARSG